ncbi:hypothetical protein [Phyllobacterium zundukense]|uniref:hypothetical protein n=1 Tax=Phyllobacterium zundukense TaxID=1867719 RepID=UPI001F3F0624|nr:hypothetical protein [Phyllobacterium zundukense]
MRIVIVNGATLGALYLRATGAAGAVAAKYPARKHASVAAMRSAGIQARLQLLALTLIGRIRQARIWARNSAKAETFARELSNEFGFTITACTEQIEAVAGSHIIVTTTPATNRFSAHHDHGIRR